MLNRPGPSGPPSAEGVRAADVPVEVPPAAAEPDPATAPLRWRAVLGAVVAAAMTVLDLTMTSTALGSIQAGVGAPLEKGALVISAYATAELVALALSAYLTRVFAPRTYLVGLVAVFVAGSLLAANSWSFESLLLARVVQGAASGAIMPFAYYLLVVLMRGSEKPKAISAFSLIVTGSAVLGPVLCITIAEWVSWRTLYYVSVPVAALALWLALPGLRTVPAGRPTLDRRVSLLSVAAAVVGLYCVQYTLDSGNARGWFSSPVVTLTAAAAAVTLAVFVVTELRTRRPLVDLRLLRRPPFSLTCTYNVVAGTAVYASFFVIPYYLTTQGYSVRDVGTVTLVGGVVQLAVSLSLPVLLRRVDANLVAAFGAAVFGVAALLPFLAGDSPTGAEIVAAMIARSVGGGLVLAALGLMVTRSVAVADAPSGSLLFNMARSLGGSVGAAACAAFVVLRETRHRQGGAGDAARDLALHDTFAAALLLLASLTGAFLLAYALRPRDRDLRPAGG